MTDGSAKQVSYCNELKKHAKGTTFPLHFKIESNCIKLSRWPTVILKACIMKLQIQLVLVFGT